MDTKQFTHLIDIYGSSHDLWPSEIREQMTQFLMNTPAAQAYINQQRPLDNMIQAWEVPTPEMPDDFMMRLQAKIELPQSIWSILSPFSPQGLFMGLALIAGLYVGMQVPIDTDIDDSFESIAFNMDDEF